MGAFEGYYLYCDLDGTLYNDDKRVSAEDRDAICSFVGEGGRFAVATGRVPSIIGAISEHLPVNAPCILYNGAGLYDLSSRSFLVRHTMPYDLAARTVARVIQIKRDACVQIFTDSGMYEVNPNQRDDPQTLLERLPITRLPMEQIRQPILKILIAHRSADLDEIHRALLYEPSIEQLNLFRSAACYLELVAAGVDKGFALGDVRSRCGDVKKIFAIGDYNNDLNMVSLADIGGAPANAIDAVKAAADVVLAEDNNHSCVARFLETVLG